jgi:hypothetical protein
MLFVTRFAIPAALLLTQVVSGLRYKPDRVILEDQPEFILPNELASKGPKTPIVIPSEPAYVDLVKGLVNQISQAKQWDWLVKMTLFPGTIIPTPCFYFLCFFTQEFS